MTRAQEWADLLALEPPEALRDTVERALLRREEEKQARRRRWGTLARRLAPAYALAGAACAFMLVVNLSVPFALACGRLPVLGEAVKAVAFDPSLRWALESDYYQVLEGSYTTDKGVTFKPYCLMASDQRVSLLCTFDQGVAWSTLTDGDGEKLNYGTASIESGKMVLSNFDFIDQELPDTLTFTYSFFDGDRVGETVGSHSGEDLGEITFTVRLDEHFRREKRVVELGTTFTLDGQTLTAERLILTPISSQLVLTGDGDNTAWLRDLSFYLEDERGRQYAWAGSMWPLSGVKSYPQDGGEFIGNYRISGLYDQDLAHLTLHVTGARWLTKDRPDTVLHLDTGEAEHLPDYVQDWRWTGTSEEESGDGSGCNLHFDTAPDIPAIPFIREYADGVTFRNFGYRTYSGSGPLHVQGTLEGVTGETITFRVAYDSYTSGQDVAVELY